MPGFERRDWWLAAAASCLALAARLSLATTHPYGDEAHHYYVSREFGATPENLVGAGDLRWLFWWRPLFALLLSLGAQHSFLGFRVQYVLLTSLLAGFAFLFLRARGVRRIAAGTGAAILALHPFFVVWGVRAFPDELMATFYVLGLLLWEQRRWVLAGLALLVACWVKEVALVGVLLLLGEHLWATRSRWRPRPTRGAAVLAVTLALAYVPHWYAESLGGRSPGWTRGGSLAGVLDGAFLTVWFVPFVLLALVSRPARRPALHALAYLGFFAAYQIVLGGAAEQWYFVLPAGLAALAICAALGEWFQRAAQTFPQHLARVAPLALAAGLVLTQVMVPAASAQKDGLHPLPVEVLDFSAPEAWAFERQRDAGLWQAIDAMTPQDREGVFLVDVAWFYAVWPFPDLTGAVGAGFTDNGDTSEAWAHVIETLATATFLARTDTPLNEAIRMTYVDCIAYENPDYLVLRGMDCTGRATVLDQLRQARAAGRPS